MCSVLSDTFVTPGTTATQAPLCIGFPRQESWSGLPWALSGNILDQGMELASLNIYLHWWADSLPLLPPGKLYSMYEVLVTQSCPTPCDTMDCSPPVSFVHGILRARIQEWVAISFSISPGDLPDPEIEPRSLALKEDSLLTELQRKPLFYIYSLPNLNIPI